MNYFADETIERYLAGKLSTEEQEQFITALAEDPKLRQEVGLHRTALQIIQIEGEQELKARIRTISNEVTIVRKPNAAIYKYWKPITLLAAAVSLLFIAYFSFLRPPLHERLFQQHFALYQLEVQRSATIEDIPPFEQGTRLYQTQDYAAALPYFLQVVAQNPEARMAAAHCYIQLADYKAARQQLDLLSTSVFVDDALWYQALIALQEDELSTAQQFFQLLTEQQNPYTKTAQTILQQLPTEKK